MAGRSYIKGFFEGIKKRTMKKAEKRLTENLPVIADMMHDYAEEEMRKLKKSSMTGNFINSFGVALYRDGKFVAIGTTHDIEGDSPTQVTLANGDTFTKWRMRYEGRMQFHTFTATEGTHRFYANEEVIRWLRRYPPTRKAGFSFRAVTVVDYSESAGGDRVLLRIADDISNRGGVVTEFHLG
ncbi:MAG: hypothetical protein IJ588_12545 [Prevotella sp.]|nr:hypothetical protein [Prevotella sp.]